jgi:hypothetical protein
MHQCHARADAHAARPKEKRGGRCEERAVLGLLLDVNRSVVDQGANE